jgi:5-enolpyruvylshikimate-3-phosphate synthase
MAMSLACLALIGLKVELDDWQCVRKSFPEFWNELHELGFDSVYI